MRASRILKLTPVLVPAAIAVVVGVAATSFASSPIPFGSQVSGIATFYNDSGFGACGTQIDAATQDLVAAPAAFWTTANPNNDPLCHGVSIRLTFQGHTITVPVLDKCPSCAPNHIDLSQPVFQRLAPLGVGVLQGVTWEFVSSAGGSTAPGGTGVASPAPAPPATGASGLTTAPSATGPTGSGTAATGGSPGVPSGATGSGPAGAATGTSGSGS